MTIATPAFRTRLATSEADLQAAQRLRYEVFVEELGGGGPLVDHAARLERDRFDPYFDHLLLTEEGAGQVIGVYRLLRGDRAEAAGGFYSEGEYDLGVLKRSGRSLLELGRSCVHRDFRGGVAMMHLWSALADYVRTHRIEILFGVASFHGTDVAALAQPLSLLHHRHLAPPDMRVRALEKSFQTMDLVPEAQIDRKRAMVAIPSLIKGYLRLGGCVGEGAFVDRAFNTTDVCLVMDTQRLGGRQARLYGAAG